MHFVTGLYEVQRHGTSHGSEADESDYFRSLFGHAFSTPVFQLPAVSGGFLLL
jgi:hypothetical protein